MGGFDPLHVDGNHRRGVSKTVAVIIIIAIIAVAGVIVDVFSGPNSNTTTSLGSSTAVASSSSHGLATASSSGCCRPSTSTASSGNATTLLGGTTRDTLVIDDTVWPASDMNQLFDASLTEWPNWFEYTVYQPLVTVDVAQEYQTGNITYIPMLAKNWTVSPDGMTYTFNLRSGIKFSNGDPFNAYQMWLQMYGYYYLSGNSSNWLVSYDLFNMSQANFGPSTIAMINGTGGVINPSPTAMRVMSNSSWPIYVNGPNQIVFHMQTPFRWFLGTMVVFDGLVLDTQYVLDHGGFGTPSSFSTYFNTNSIPGTGPYVVSGIAENDYVKFTQSPTYWGRNLTTPDLQRDVLLDPGHAKNVVVYYKPDDTSRYVDLSTGVAQIAAIQAPNWDLVLANPDKYSYAQTPPWAALTNAVSLNTHLYPTNITAFRQAIVHAINYTEVREKAFLGVGSPYVGPEYPAWKQFYDLGEYPPYSYNLTLARQYLAAANLPNIPALNMSVISSCTNCVEMAQVIQSDLSQIGITLDISIVQASTYYASYGSYASSVQNPGPIGHLSLLGVNWAPNALTPADNWVTFVSNQSVYGNSAVYSNPVVQKCVDAFTQTNNVSEIQQLCTAAQKQIYVDAPYAWLGVSGLWYGGGSFVWQKGVVQGFYFDPIWSGGDTAPIFNTVTFD